MGTSNVIFIERIYEEIDKVRALVNLGSKVGSEGLEGLEGLDLMNIFQVILDYLSLIKHEVSLLEDNEKRFSFSSEEPIQDE